MIKHRFAVMYTGHATHSALHGFQTVSFLMTVSVCVCVLRVKLCSGVHATALGTTASQATWKCGNFPHVSGSDYWTWNTVADLQ